MSEAIALVTGAGGFVGGWVVEALLKRGARVRAGVHGVSSVKSFALNPGVEPIAIDLLDQQSLQQAMRGIDTVYHFAALVDPEASKDALFKINVEGTRNVWKSASENGVKAALYCSTAAVYGLLSSSDQPVSEETKPRPFEPYGRSKLTGESVALEIGTKKGLPTIVIRPVAIFGPGQRLPIRLALRNAAFSSFLLARAFRARMFSFVHVGDVADAAVHLMHTGGCEWQTFNVAVDKPVSIDEAFKAYFKALDQSGQFLMRARFLAWASALMEKIPISTHLLLQELQHGNRPVFTVWGPGSFITYSSKKLINTSFRFKWASFEEVLLSSLSGRN